jgi:DNA-binding CsgD family transcriptional regulator
LPDLKDSDRRLMLYIAGGLPTYLIAAIFGKTRPAVNMQISRLRRQIESMDARIQSRMLKYFDKRSSGRPKK